ncbi:hypothetical protein T02_6323 [Trichinella nativa]|uniref:Uncharacterized protein n=1 Tax=Trichinella nativa TaxID=6335 RepID=A0A0V1L513_9BILA|nr:hypothetical protein T06_8954 [Trichinella sp. T6]KRZ54619.1 hypothetical protein T02_6323 [Trichinella nativa]
MEKEKEKQRQSHNDGQIMFYLFYKNTSFTIFLFKRRIGRILQGSCIDGYLPQWAPSWNQCQLKINNKDDSFSCFRFPTIQTDAVTGRCVCFLSNNQMRVNYCDGAINGELDRIVGPEWVRLPDVLTRSSNVETRRRGGQCDGATLRWKVKLKDH